MSLFDDLAVSRFWSKVDKCDPVKCWDWLGRTRADKYRKRGWFDANGTSYMAHRVSAIIHHGEPPQGMECLHSCDNPMCCNPSHLSWGTHLQNMQDCSERGRSRGKKTHCKRGHEYTPENVIKTKQNKRICKSCASQRKRGYRIANMEKRKVIQTRPRTFQTATGGSADD